MKRKKDLSMNSGMDQEKQTLFGDDVGLPDILNDDALVITLDEVTRQEASWLWRNLHDREVKVNGLTYCITRAEPTALDGSTFALILVRM